MDSLWITGAGDLGWRVARQVYQKQQRLVLETRSPRRHGPYRILGAELHTIQDLQFQTKPCSQLLICFPPSDDYEQRVKDALQRWNRRGTAVLVSSTGVYAENAGGSVNLASATVDSPMLGAEQLALAAGCHVVRMAGLFSAQSGPHLYWERRASEKQGTPLDSPEARINLIHRHDAACALALLLQTKPSAAKIWNLSDGHSLTRGAVASEWMAFRGASIELGKQGTELGKVVSPSEAWNDLGWAPRWKSFLDFVDSVKKPRNVFGRALKVCSTNPMTGYQRDGCCKPNIEDSGEHTICCEMNDEFLGFSKSRGNDLSTPRPEYGFSGLTAGQQWCVCAPRWFEAWIADRAPRMYLESSHESLLEWAPFKRLAPHALDLA